MRRGNRTAGVRHMTDPLIGDVITVTHIQSIAMISTRQGLHNFPARGHNEIIYKLSGRSFVTINGVGTEEYPGIVRVMPGDPAEDRYTSRVETDTVDVIDIFFDTKEPLCRETFYIRTLDDPETRQLFINAANIWKGKARGYYTKCMSILYRILFIIQKESDPVYLPAEQAARLEPAINYIREHAFDGDRLDYRHMGELCGMSYSWFRSLFAKRFGISPQGYVLRIRLLHACDLLTTGMYSVSEVSESCGFQSLSYFSRVFKEKYGISPGEYTGSV